MNLNQFEKTLNFTKLEILEEVKKASAESQKAFETKAKEINQAFEAKAKQIEEAVKDNASRSEVDDLKGQLNAIGNQLDEIQTSQKMANGNQVKSFTDQIQDGLKNNTETLQKLKADKSQNNLIFDVNFDMNTKAAGTMTTANYSGGTVGLSSWDPMFSRIVRRQPFLRQIVNVRPVSSKYVAWAEQANADGGAGATAEGAAKTQADFDIVESNKLVEKITSYIKVSKEALDDIAFLRSEIDTELVELLNLKLDADILGANGTTPNIKGILSYATTYDPASTVFEDAIEEANNFDVIRAVAATLSNTSYQANYVLVNPLDAGLMDMIKVSASDGRYVLPPFYSASGQVIAGLRVIENPGVTAGTFVIGDFNKSNLAMREEINIQVGYENDDFTKNLVTILGELRATHYIKSNDTGAFYKGTFATVAAALEKPVV